MNGYNHYKEKSIYSMSGPELLLLLFDESIKRLTRAELSLDEKNYDDFEDCLQDRCAESIEAEYIITRNVVDFAGSEVTAISPEDFFKVEFGIAL